MPGKLYKNSKKGFTILELLIVALLMVMVTMIIAQFWRWILPSITDLNARWHILRENRLALQNLASDFGSTVGIVPVNSEQLMLCQDGGDFPNGLADWSAPDRLVDYSLVNTKLIRSDISSGMEVTVADCVSGFEVELVSPTLLRISLELSSYNVTRQMVFFWSQP